MSENEIKATKLRTLPGEFEIIDKRINEVSYDATSEYANQKIITRTLRFVHVATSQYVLFKAALTSYNENYASQYNSEDVYGRNDSIDTFQNTKRSYSLAFQMVAFDEFDADSNMVKLSNLIRILYPTYKNDGNALTISKSPMIRLRFGNLVPNLLGNIYNLSITPELEAGFFEYIPTGGSWQVLDGFENSDKIAPKVMNISFDFQVKHEHNLGWINGSWDGDRTSDVDKRDFPYQNARINNPNGDSFLGGVGNLDEELRERQELAAEEEELASKAAILES